MYIILIRLFLLRKSHQGVSLLHLPHALNPEPPAPNHLPVNLSLFSTLQRSVKDLTYALALAEELGVDAAGAALVRSRFDEVIERGWGEHYSPVIYRLFEEDGGA